MLQSHPLLTLTFLTLLLAPSLSTSSNYFSDHSLFLENSAIVAASTQASQSGKLRVDFFVESLSDSSMTFFKDFAPIYHHMKENIDFIPHYIFKVCAPCALQNYTINIPECVSGGRFCVRNTSIFQNWDGRDIVMQSIREICIYKKSPEKWWQYQAKLAECDKACYDDVYADLGLSQEDIEKCATNSFINGDEMNDNILLREAKNASKNFTVEENNVFIDVNGKKHREKALPVSSLIHKICSNFTEKISYCQTIVSTDNANTNKPPSFNGFHVFIGFTTLIGIAYILYARSLNKPKDPVTGIQLDETVSQYFALEDEDTKKAVRRISMQKLDKEKKEISDSNDLLS